MDCLWVSHDNCIYWFIKFGKTWVKQHEQNFPRAEFLKGFNT